MITAREAKQRTQENLTNKYNKLLKDIEGKIKFAIINGDFAISYDEKFPKFIEDTLIEAGYKVNYRQCGINEYETVISWDDVDIKQDDDDPYPCKSCGAFDGSCCGCDKEKEWNKRHEVK